MTVQAAQQITQAAFAIDDLRTKSLRAEKGFQILSGGAAKAGASIRAIQNASGGTIDRLTALEVGNQALALGLAKTSEQFTDLTRAARSVALISPVIHDVQGAISELGLAAANMSWRRLDQLGLSVSEVRKRFKELQSSNPELDDSAAFLAASVEILNSKYGALLDTQEANASGAEELRVQWEDLKAALATGPIGEGVDAFFKRIADSIREVQVLLGQGTGTQIGSEIDEMIASVKNPAAVSGAGWLNPAAALGKFITQGSDTDAMEAQVRRLEDAARIIKELEGSAARGAPGAEAALAKAAEIIGEVKRNAALGQTDAFTRELSDQIQALAANYRQLSADIGGYGDATADAFAFDKQAAEALALKKIALEELAKEAGKSSPELGAFAVDLAKQDVDQDFFIAEIARMEEFISKRNALEGQITNSASALVERFGIPQAKAILDQQMAELHAAFQRFNEMGLEGPELDLNISGIAAQLAAQTDAFIVEADRLKEAANLDSITTQLGQSLANLNSGAFDGVEGISAVREELLSLASDVMFASGATDEQAAQFAYLAAVAEAASSSTSYFGMTQAALGVEFLNTNDYAGALASEMANLDGAYATGAISADYHRAALITLVDAIYAAAQAAGAAAPQLASLLALKNALLASGPVNTPQGVRGTQVGQSIQQREALKAGLARREQLRDQQAAAAKEAAKGFKSAAGSAAKDFNSAAKSTKQAFENAAKTLESALRKVPGLFGNSEVTQEQLDLAKAGGDVNFADNWRRRFEDEIKNGKDWEDVSIDQAKEALERIGVTVGSTNEEILAQINQAWSDSSLFADKANLALINQDAVRQQLQIQDKIKQGQQNILDLFGATVDGVMAGVKAGDAQSLALVAGELEGSDDKSIQEMAKGLRESNAAMIEKVLALAIAEPMEAGGGGGSAGGASLGIPDAPIFDPSEFYDNAIDPFVTAGNYLSEPAFFAGFDAFKKGATSLADWSAALPVPTMPATLPAGQFGPANRAGALPDMAAFGSMGPVAGPALTVDPATATNYMTALAAEFTKSQNTDIFATVGKGLGQVLGVSMAQADNSIQATGYVQALGVEFIKSTNTDMLATVGKGMAQVLGVSMAQADNAVQATGYMQNLQTKFYAADNLEIQRQIGVGIQATIGGGIIDNSTGTNAAVASAYMANLAAGFSGPDVGAIPIAIGDTLAFLVDAGFNEHVGADKANKFLTDTSTQFGVLTANFQAIGDNAATFVGWGWDDHDFGPQADSMIADLKAAFSNDSAVSGFRSLGAIAAEGAFAGFKETLTGQGWLAAIRDELLSDAMESLAASVESSMEATTVARSQ